MEIYEITGNVTGISREGVNYLQPADSYQNLENGFIYRQVLQSRKGISLFAPRLADKSRIFGIYEHILPNSSKELLLIDKNFLYRWNNITGIFDQIPFAGSMAAYTGFNMTAKNFYVSGTSYPTATNTQRFIFTGQGITPNGAGSSIFFYNGTDVRDFTSIVDNPNYAPPTLGALTLAHYVTYFGERLNFIYPVIGGTDYAQGFLYSGIRNGVGNGDKFNVAGSGLLQADTSQDITGFVILGQIIALNLRRSNWTIEKTRDAFNPYFIRKIPSVEGTDALFSSIEWNDRDFSIGRTGIITTDGRTSLKTDTKIPYFTQDEIDQIDFDLTYGGFDRINNQFLWSYKQSESESDTQNKVLCYNYEESTWNTYDLRLTVFGQTDLGLNLSWDDIDETIGNESWSKWDTTEELWDTIGLGQSVQKTLAGDDLGFIYNINQDFEDYYADISAITQASNAVLTVSESAFQAGDKVIIENVNGMTQINNTNANIYTIITATDTSITLNVDSSLYDAYTSGGSISKVIEFRAETIPINPYRSAGSKVNLSHVEFLIDTNGGYLSVDFYADEQTAPFKQDVLLIPTLTTQAREWITCVVNQEANFITIKMKQDSVDSQVRLTSMRLHMTEGGLTSG